MSLKAFDIYIPISIEKMLVFMASNIDLVIDRYLKSLSECW